jgi:hypothetical protein
MGISFCGRRGSLSSQLDLRLARAGSRRPSLAPAILNSRAGVDGLDRRSRPGNVRALNPTHEPVMTMPAFTAGLSLYETQQRHQTVTVAHSLPRRPRR